MTMALTIGETCRVNCASCGHHESMFFESDTYQSDAITRCMEATRVTAHERLFRGAHYLANIASSRFLLGCCVSE
jgi:hypothetical protein